MIEKTLQEIFDVQVGAVILTVDQESENFDTHWPSGCPVPEENKTFIAGKIRATIQFDTFVKLPKQEYGSLLLKNTESVNEEYGTYTYTAFLLKGENTEKIFQALLQDFKNT